jgi:flagellar hook assembly protein FlgD
VQDAVTIHYRVLQPVHLEFAFINESGDRVRTLKRDHALIGEYELLWDGRDESGLPVPDGEYRMTVQNYEFFVHVDGTPPEVRITLFDAYQKLETEDGDYVWVAPHLEWCTRDENLDSNIVFTGRGEDPAVWEEHWTAFPPCLDDIDPMERQPISLTLEEFVDHRFRLDATDLGGSEARISTTRGAEQLIVAGFGPDIPQPAAVIGPVSWAPLNSPNGSGLVFHLTYADVRFVVAETIREEIFELYVQFRSVDDSSWQETRLAGSAFSNDWFWATWDLAGIVPGDVSVLRLRAIDVTSREHISNALSIQTEGITFQGNLPDEPWPPVLYELRDEAMKAGTYDPEDLHVWATEFIAEPLDVIRLHVQSDEDPRYANWVTLDSVIGVADGGILFKLEDWAECKNYRGYVTVLTTPVENPDTGQLQSRSLQSGEEDFDTPCLEVKMQVEPELAPVCGDPSPSTLHFDIGVKTHKQTELQLLTLARKLEDGEEDIFFSVNHPTNNSSHEYDLDTSNIPEGEQTFIARLTDIDDDYARSLEKPPIDHTPPDQAIDFPLENQRLCGIPMEIGGEIFNVFYVEGRLDDEFGADYRLTLKREFEEPLTFEVDGIDPKTGQRFLITSKHGTLGIYGDSDKEEPFVGDATLLFETFDWGGFHTCTETTFFFDGAVEGTELRSDRRLFSPNADGTLDLVTLEYGSDELTFVDLDVYPALENDQGVLVITGPRIRSLVAQDPVLDSSFREWNGLDDNGIVVPDGLYLVVATFEDACGNLAKKKTGLEVDNTPPQAEILYPQTGDPVTMIIEILGSVSDVNLQAYTVDYGGGFAPETWGRLDAGTVERQQEILAVWNTYGLEGDFTIRLLAVDLAGNQRDIQVALTLTVRINLITYLEAVPRLFSPNGDGKRETSSVRFGLDAESVVTLEILDDQSQLARTLIDGQVLGVGAAIREWNGRTDSGEEAPDGTYFVSLEAALAVNPLITQDEKVTAVVDRTPPLIEITNPGEGFATGTSSVRGTIGDLHLLEWVISLTDTPDTPVWMEIGTGSTSRVNTNLAPLGGLEDGDYSLRVEAVDEGEIRTEVVLPFQVDNTPPAVTLSEPIAGSYLSAAQGPAPVKGAIEEENLELYRLHCRGAHLLGCVGSARRPLHPETGGRGQSRPGGRSPSAGHRGQHTTGGGDR